MTTRNYGSFFQEGGESTPTQMPVDQMMQQPQEQQQPQGQGQNQDAQAIAQKFMEAFAQIPPEAQQLVAQAIMQMTQGQNQG